MAFIIPNAADTLTTPYAVLDQAEPDSLDFEILGNASRCGILSGGVVSANGSGGVSVTAGTAVLDGKPYTFDARSFSLTPNIGTGSKRFDVVIFRIGVGITHLNGEESAVNPTFPQSKTITGVSGVDFSTDVVLAAVYRSGNVNDSHIVDKRVIWSSTIPDQGTTDPSGGSTGSIYYKSDTSSGSEGSGIYIKNSAGTWVQLPQLANNNVTNARLRDSSGLSVIGRSAATPGDPADIVASADGQALRRSSGVLGFGTIETAGITANAVTNTVLRDSSALSVIGRSANSTGDPADITAGTNGHVLRRSDDSLGFGTIPSSSVSDLTETVQDIVGGMVSGNTESGISVTYQDIDGTLDFSLVKDPTITLAGGVTGSATMTDLGDVSITTVVKDDSHNHVVGNIDSFTENVQDIVGGMVSSNGEFGIAVTYQDSDGTLDFNVVDYLFSYSDYTPTFTASTTNPAVGTGGSIYGRYARVGNFVHCVIYIKFGTSGWYAGNGLYEVGLPTFVSPDLGGYASENVGSGYFYDSSVGKYYSLVAKRYTSSTVRMYNTAEGYVVGHLHPMAPGSGDVISLNLTFIKL